MFQESHPFGYLYIIIIRYTHYLYNKNILYKYKKIFYIIIYIIIYIYVYRTLGTAFNLQAINILWLKRCGLWRPDRGGPDETELRGAMSDFRIGVSPAVEALKLGEKQQKKMCFVFQVIFVWLEIMIILESSLR